MKFAVCDDDEKYAADLKQQIVGYFSTSQGIDVRIFSSGESLMEAIISNKNKFDAIFLDVLMPGQNGMSVARQLQRGDIRSPIIFVSSSRDHSTEGYFVDAIAYLIKPVSNDNLKRALNKLMKLRERTTEKYLVINIEKHLVKIPISQINILERDNRKTSIIMTDGKILHTNYLTSELMDKYHLHSDFAIYSQSNYVNIGNIKKFDKRESEITMKNDRLIYVSRAHIKQIINMFAQKNGGII